MLIASVSCEENEESMKLAKREASIGSFSYSASNFGNKNGGHAKSLTFIKSQDGLIKQEYHKPGTVVFSANDNYSVLDNSNSKRYLNNYNPDDGPKSTIEFWPIDLDKNKFYQLKNKSPAMQYWPEQMTGQMKVQVTEPMPEIMFSTLPLFVPIVRETTTASNKIAITGKKEIPEAAVAKENKDPGPVLFPIILDPTTVRPNKQIVAAVPRGQKQKKLKKKLNAPKVYSIVEISPPAASTESSVDKDEDSNLNLQPTPIYEIIDEPTNYEIPSAFNPSNVNQEIIAETQYTNQDVINSLRNLKEVILNSNKSPATNSSMMTMIDLAIESQNVEVENSSSSVTESSEGSNSGAIKTIEKPLTISTDTQGSTMNKIVINIDSSASELNNVNNNMFTELQVAVNDRDVKKIKEIAVLLQEPLPFDKDIKVLKNPFDKDINVLNIPIETVTMSNKDRRRIYLAPTIKNINQTSLIKEQEPILDSVKSIINAIYNSNEEQTSTIGSIQTVTDEPKVYLAPRVRIGRIKMNKGSMDIPVNNFNNNSNIETSTFAAFKPNFYLAPKIRNKNGTRVGRMVRRRKLQL